MVTGTPALTAPGVYNWVFKALPTNMHLVYSTNIYPKAIFVKWSIAEDLKGVCLFQLIDNAWSVEFAEDIKGGMPVSIDWQSATTVQWICIQLLLSLRPGVIREDVVEIKGVIGTQLCPALARQETGICIFIFISWSAFGACPSPRPAGLLAFSVSWLTFLRGSLRQHRPPVELDTFSWAPVN